MIMLLSKETAHGGGNENDTSFPLYTTSVPTATLLEAHCAREHAALICYNSAVFHLHTQEEGKHNQPHQTK